MKLRIANDLHLDVNKLSFNTCVPSHTDDSHSIFICSGDIAPIHSQSWHDAMNEISKRFQSALIVPGNHEYYDTTLTDTSSLDRYNNISILKRDKVMINDRLFVGATLWTNFKGRDPIEMRKALAFMQDYQRISQRSSALIPIRPSDILSEHEKDYTFIKDTSTRSSIVISHHVPIFDSLQKFASSSLNGAFVNDYSHLVNNCSMWIHGHSHEFADYEYNGTRVINNPYGYSNEQTDYKSYLFIESNSLKM